MEGRWIQPDKERRAEAQRAANLRAQQQGKPLPYPNPWDALDQTKVAEGASDAAFQRSYLAFCNLCPPPPCKTHSI
jgi:hypothetical protein